MLEFQIAGPYKIPHYTAGKKKIKHFDKSGQDDFWDDSEDDCGVDLSLRNWCYIFGVRTKRVFLWYVGKATKRLGGEIFTNDTIILSMTMGRLLSFWFTRRSRTKRGLRRWS
jgi:hypothetical protein